MMLIPLLHKTMRESSRFPARRHLSVPYAPATQISMHNNRQKPRDMQQASCMYTDTVHSIKRNELRICVDAMPAAMLAKHLPHFRLQNGETG